MCTTYLARVTLHGLLDKLGDRVPYMDTDSVIFEERSGDGEMLSTGKYFGDLTDDAPPGTNIVEFVGAGPKNYGTFATTGSTMLQIPRTTALRHLC